MGVGPCTPYLDGAAAAAEPDACGATAAQLAPFCVMASDILYVLLGRQFPGVCSATVRPTAHGNCWPTYSAYSVPFGAIFGPPLGLNDHAYDPSDPIWLSTPVISIDEVLIDGVAFTAYALRNRAQLIRTDGKRWPRTTNVAPDTDPNTFSVTYTYGPPTPAMVVSASKELTIELWKESSDSGSKLPRHTSSVNRQGLSLTVDHNVDRVREAGPALPRVMSAMAAYNPTNQRIPAAVYSPDSEWRLPTIS